MSSSIEHRLVGGVFDQEDAWKDCACGLSFHGAGNRAATAALEEHIRLEAAKRQPLPTAADLLPVYQQVLWCFGDEGLGVQPSRFEAGLIRLFRIADPGNFSALQDSFPQYALAVRRAFTDAGLDELRAAVKDARDAAVTR